LVSSFIVLRQDVSIIEEYDIKSSYHMLVKCYHHLDPLTNNEWTSTLEKVVEDYKLDIFEMITNTSEQAKNESMKSYWYLEDNN
jgi:hypothetical protein